MALQAVNHVLLGPTLLTVRGAARNALVASFLEMALIIAAHVLRGLTHRVDLQIALHVLRVPILLQDHRVARNA